VPLVNQKKTVKKESAETSRDWDFKVRESNIKRVDFNYDNNNIAAIRGFDYNHLKLQSLSIDAQDIHFQLAPPGK
jgi:hypothetical protein